MGYERFWRAVGNNLSNKGPQALIWMIGAIVTGTYVILSLLQALAF